MRSLLKSRGFVAGVVGASSAAMATVASATPPAVFDVQTIYDTVIGDNLGEILLALGLIAAFSIGAAFFAGLLGKTKRTAKGKG